eukprot:TRINITY_DN20913_c0_g2_i3.p2 TRINITY_DN20913_c0_g2~~TRINITY_DN20913_c0_g2_i3.p2  ORF type:complete len:100 (-),score=7.16 TRINITY_DN20913_c0_g2_i3:118-417(-)
MYCIYICLHILSAFQTQILVLRHVLCDQGNGSPVSSKHRPNRGALFGRRGRQLRGQRGADERKSVVSLSFATQLSALLRPNRDLVPVIKCFVSRGGKEK